MKQWNGLAQREWILWRWQLVIAVGITLICLFLMPTIVGVTTGDAKMVFETTMVFSFMVVMVGLIIPVISFSTMFNRDMKQPDLWLHSTASAYKLIGVKFFVAACIGACSLLLPAFVVAIRFAMVEVTEITFDELAFFGTALLVFLFATSLTIMAVGFFFIVIDRLLKPFLKGFSIVVTGILLVLSVRVYGEITKSGFYERFIHNGKLDLMAMKNPELQIGSNSYIYMKTDIYIGDMLFDLMLTVGLFLIAITLFDKKVRV